MKNKHGGKRLNAGRKPIPVKKQALFIYLEETTIENVGGRDEAKKIAEQAVIKRAKNILK